MNFNDVAIVSIKENDHRIHFWYMSKNSAISIMNSSDLKKVDRYNFLLFYIKNDGTTYYETKRDLILNRDNVYYENNKEVLREKAKNKYRELPEERICKKQIS